MPLFSFRWKRGKKGILRIPVPFDPGAKSYVFGAEIGYRRESVSYLENRILQSKSKTSEAAGVRASAERRQRDTR